jgi:hypothetical protein
VGEGPGFGFFDGVELSSVLVFFPLRLKLEQQVQVLVDDACEALLAE